MCDDGENCSSQLRKRKVDVGSENTPEEDPSELISEEDVATTTTYNRLDGIFLKENVPRKPSRVTLSDNLTVFVDDYEAPIADEAHGLLLQEIPSSTNFLSYFWSELTRGYSLHNDQSRYSEKRRKVYAFFWIPWELERFLLFGLLQCIDAFTYLFTFLPIRFVMSIFGFICRIRPWTSAETCDLLKVGIIVCATAVMQWIDTSFVYHQVRSQGVIKLYIFYNMLEVADKLFSSLGQDVLDSLFWTANEKFGVRSILWTVLHFVFALIYAILHTFLVLLQATTLNVAFNSHNQSLLMIMMSNNFVELKGSVFKKFAKANLFQMSCSDVRERFHIMALLFVVMIRNMMAVNWSTDHFLEMIPDLLMVCCAELLVDWLKHAFITKFNEINAAVYRDYTITISFDVIKSRDVSAFSDYSDQVSRRMGFIPIPLSIMLILVISQTFSFNNWPSVVLLGLAWLLMLSIKISNGIILLGRACNNVATYRELQARSELDLYRKRILEKKSKSAPSSPKLSIVEFYDVCHQPPGVKGFTMSDLWDELQSQPEPRIIDQVTPRPSTDDRTPRRTKSFASLSRSRRDTSVPPSASGAVESGEEGRTREGSELGAEKSIGIGDREGGAQTSPKKKIQTKGDETLDDCEKLLHDVTAYTMLAPEKGVERIE